MFEAIFNDYMSRLRKSKKKRSKDRHLKAIEKQEVLVEVLKEYGIERSEQEKIDILISIAEEKSEKKYLNIGVVGIIENVSKMLIIPITIVIVSKLVENINIEELVEIGGTLLIILVYFMITAAALYYLVSDIFDSFRKDYRNFAYELRTINISGSTKVIKNTEEAISNEKGDGCGDRQVSKLSTKGML